MPTVGSLFSGIGGLDLGLERAGFQVRWQVEIDDYARRVLAKHWPGIPKYRDIKELTGDEFEPVDLIAAGWPCQDLSNAGPRAGLSGERSGLWREVVRIVRVVRPRLILLENVAALLGRGMGTVLGDLAEAGYDAEWDCLSACEFGAPHTRERVFIVAHAASNGREQGRALATSDLRIFSGVRDPRPDLWRPESRPVGVVNGAPHRIQRCRGVGNGVVVPIAEYIGRRILAAL